MADAEAEVRVEVEGRTLTLSNLRKVLYPNTGTTKGEVLNYYAQVSPVLLPHLHDRAVTRIRWPHGTGDKSFFEKNLPSGAPSWLKTVAVPTTGSRGGKGDKIVFPIVDDLADLDLPGQPGVPGAARAPVDSPATGTPTAWSSTSTRVLPPISTSAPRWRCWCVTGWPAQGLSCAPVTSGSKGLHLYAAAARRPHRRRGARQGPGSSRRALQEESKLVVWKMTKSLRPGKVFLDWSQNTGAKTTISPYSLRGKPTPYVAAPRTWEEVEEGAEERHALSQLTHEEVLRRVERQGDIFGDLLGSAS